MITDQKTIDALKELNYTQVYEKGKEDARQEILDLIDKFQKELLEIIDDCISDWSYIERKYNEKFDELKQQLNQPKTENEF